MAERSERKSSVAQSSLQEAPLVQNFQVATQPQAQLTSRTQAQHPLQDQQGGSSSFRGRGGYGGGNGSGERGRGRGYCRYNSNTAMKYNLCQSEHHRAPSCPLYRTPVIWLTNALKMWNPDIIPSKANTVVLCYKGSHPSPKKKEEKFQHKKCIFYPFKKRYLKKNSNSVLN